MKLSKDPRDYNIKIYYNWFMEYDEKGLIEEEISEKFKTFWLIAKDGSYERRYSTESAPDWVLQIYNKILAKNEVN